MDVCFINKHPSPSESRRLSFGVFDDPFTCERKTHSSYTKPLEVVTGPYTCRTLHLREKREKRRERKEGKGGKERIGEKTRV